jgi:hypothetical protein
MGIIGNIQNNIVVTYEIKFFIGSKEEVAVAPTSSIAGRHGLNNLLLIKITKSSSSTSECSLSTISMAKTTTETKEI